MATAAVFDLDGTLFDARAIPVRAAREAFTAHGLEPPTEDEVVAFIGRPWAEFHAWIRERAPAVGDAVAADLDERELALVGEEGRLFPAAAAVLRDVRVHVDRVAVLTNGGPDYVTAVLQATGIGPLLDRVRTRRPRDTGKAQMLADLLDDLGADRGVVIGDRPDDVAAARANGLHAIGALHGYGTADDLAGADLLVDDIAAVPAAVASLLGDGHRAS